jgi:hypothetical protein
MMDSLMRLAGFGPLSRAGPAPPRRFGPSGWDCLRSTAGLAWAGEGVED